MDDTELCADSQAGRITPQNCVVKKRKYHQCDECCYVTDRCGNLTIHKRTHSGEKPYKCDQCEQCFAQNANLRNHKRTHSGNKPCKCDQCGNCFSTTRSLTIHKRRHSGEKPYKCDKCDKCFADQSALGAHKRTHSETKPYKCDQCDQCFVDNGYLTTHKRTHSGEKPFKCDQCDHCFSHRNSLALHKRIHSGEKPYKCNECDKCFADKNGLTIHMRAHSGNKPYKCDQCDKCFSVNCSLTKHKRVHSGEKPYKCDQCDKCFAESGHLKIHKRTHTGEKPYKCEHCPKSFTCSSQRSVHHKMHETQKNYKFVCPMQDNGLQPALDVDLKCTIRCKTQHHLQYHIQMHHTEEGIAKKFHTETKLAEFFTSKEISFDRDWVNRIMFSTCTNIEGKKQSARPDFYLHARSAELGCVFLVGNDEFAHRQTKCEFQRMFNIINALQQTKEFANVSIVYVRFNPHFFKRDNTHFDMPLEKAHELLLAIILRIQRKHIKPGMNLVYVNYDTRDGKLCVFDKEEEDNYSDLFVDCVLQFQLGKKGQVAKNMYARPFYTVVSFVLFLVAFTYPTTASPDTKKYTTWLRLLFQVLPLDPSCKQIFQQLIGDDQRVIASRSEFVDLVFVLHERILHTKLNRERTMFFFDQLRATECSRSKQEKEAGCVRPQRISRNVCCIFFHDQSDPLTNNNFMLDHGLVLATRKDIEHDSMTNQNPFCSCVFSALWFLLHVVASQFPDDASKATRDQYVQWLLLFGEILPCFVCRVNFENNLKAIQFDPEKDTISRYMFEMAIYHLHSAVNEMLGQSNLPFHEMKLMYDKLSNDVQNRHFATVTVMRKENDVRFFDLA